ncbi:MAG TPA: exosortase B [Burkholderiales bacterium]|nr:exosortase B [Burkholderiales bacterium]
MSTVLDVKPYPGGAALNWLPVAVGLLLLYVPTFYHLGTTLWQSEDHAHGPIILAVVLFLIWRQREAFLAASAPAAPKSGLGLLAFGLLLYVVGRSQDINLFEVGALLPILAGTLLAMRGWRTLRTLWFPILFAVFLIPFPDVFVDSVTGPLKQNVSAIAEQILYVAGYPVARNGVVLTVGQYQMLVADACSGLNSMFSLSALGLLYLYLVGRKSWIHNAIIVTAILPIAFAANVVRVIALVLVTYHFGDEAGQGFLHGAAGLLLVMAALIIVLLLDAVLLRLTRQKGMA